MKTQSSPFSDHLTQTFAALADPTRRAMLARLSRGEANVSDLAKPFLEEMSLPAVTKHLKVLERAGLITKTREAQFRPCKLNGDGLKDAFNWIEHYRRFWEESFDRLEEYLKTVTAKQIVAAKPIVVAKNTVAVKQTRLKGKQHGRKK
jgi:DNA-binding transcriptional ArsR family regulator